MRSRVVPFVAAVASLLVGMPLAVAGTANRIVAIVNNEIITDSDVAVHMNALLSGEDPPAPDQARAVDMRRAVLQRLIEERLIVQEAKRLNLTVGAEEILEQLRVLREHLGSKDAYQEMLKETGLSEEQLKSRIREQLLAKKAVDQEVRSKIAVSLQEITNASPESSTIQPPTSGEESHVYHVLVRIGPDRSPEQAKALAEELYSALQKGASFGDVLRDHAGAVDGEADGLLGWIQPGQLLPELDEAIARLKPGELAPPIRTQLGYHLVKVAERRTPTQADHQEAPRQRAAQQIYQQKFAKVFAEWIQRLSTRAYIQVLDSS